MAGEAYPDPVRVVTVGPALAFSHRAVQQFDGSAFHVFCPVTGISYLQQFDLRIGLLYNWKSISQLAWYEIIFSHSCILFFGFAHCNCLLKVNPSMMSWLILDLGNGCHSLLSFVPRQLESL